jgi:hypothetical protein
MFAIVPSMATQSTASVPRLADLAAGLGLRTPSQLGKNDRLPVGSPLDDVLPDGLRKGATVGVTSATLTLLLLASSTQAGSWAAVVGATELGMIAASELGVVLQRCALVPNAGRQPTKVIAALLDAVDVVVVGDVGFIAAADARRLIARARERRCVLMLNKTAWPEVSPLTLSVRGSHWRGVGSGEGCLRGRWIDVVVTGRGAASRQRSTFIWVGVEDGGENPEKTVHFEKSTERSAVP